MNGGKYIVLECGGNDLAVVFSPTISHLDMVQMLRREKADVIGAGFMDITQSTDNLELRCYGRSDSLGVASRGAQDARAVCWAVFGCSGQEAGVIYAE